MTKTYFTALTLVASFLLSSCGQDLPAGINYVVGKNPTIVLNQLGNSWRMFSEDRDVTSQVGLSVDNNIALNGPTLLDVELRNQAGMPLPSKFRLQWSLGGPAYCSECPEKMQVWKRSEIR